MRPHWSTPPNNGREKARADLCIRECTVPAIPDQQRSEMPCCGLHQRRSVHQFVKPRREATTQGDCHKKAQKSQKTFSISLCFLCLLWPFLLTTTHSRSFHLARIVSCSVLL